MNDEERRREENGLTLLIRKVGSSKIRGKLERQKPQKNPVMMTSDIKKMMNSAKAK